MVVDGDVISSELGKQTTGQPKNDNRPSRTGFATSTRSPAMLIQTVLGMGMGINVTYTLYYTIHYSILYCTVLYYTILYYTILYYTMPCYCDAPVLTVHWA